MRPLLSAVFLSLSTFVHRALAIPYDPPVFGGPGLAGGVDAAQDINGPVQTDLRVAILQLLHLVLSFLALAATIMVVVAGIYLVVGGGSDTSKEKAKKILLYVAIGLIIIVLSRAFVGFLLTVLI